MRPVGVTVPNVIISYDMNTAGPRNGEARSRFGDPLKAAGWADEILFGPVWQKLPQTTLVATRTDPEARGDVVAAEAAAQQVEPRFKVTKFVLSSYRRIDSRSD